VGGAPAKLGAEYTKKENGNGRFGSCVDGSVLARTFFTFAALVVQVQPCVRPVDAAGVAAGPNALRGSGPNRSPALESVMTQTGSPDPRNDRICITSSCPRQLVLPIYLLACLMPPATASAPCIFRREP
jgi:hypothetical protein